MKKQLIALLAVVMSVSMIFVACTGKPAGETSSETSAESSTDAESEESEVGESSEVAASGEKAADQSIILGTPKHEGTYNYMYSSSSYDREVCDLIYQRLVISNGVTGQEGAGIDRANDVIVEKLEISEDGKEYTFTLKDGILFSDGTPLTANDVVFTYKALADPSSLAYFLADIYPLAGAEAYYKGETEELTFVEALDEKTVVFRFTENLRTNISSCGMGILSEAYYPEWEKGKSNEAMDAKMDKPLGSGPYLLEEYAPAQYTMLKRNPDFWAKDQTDYIIDKITIKYTETDTEMDEIITKTIDVLPTILDKPFVERVLNDEDGVGAPTFINLQQYKRSAYGYIGFNTGEGPAADIALRQAVAFAFNRKEFVEAQYGDLARPLAVPMSQASSIFDAVEDGLNEYEFSLDSAKEVLIAAGYTYEEGGKMMDPAGNPVVLKFMATTGNTVINAMVPVLSANLEEIGIELVIVSIEFASLLPIVQDKTNNDWDMYFMASGWTSDEPDTWYSSFHENGIALTNSSRYNNPDVSKWLDEGRTFLDLTDQTAIDHYSQIALALNRDVPQLPVYANTITAMVNSRVANFQLDTFQGWQWAIEGAYIVDVAA